MSETATKSTKKTSAKESAAPASSDSGSAATTKSPTEKSKSGKDSMGGSAAVHYGFFSNVKTAEYRSGWDDIWSKKKKPAKRRPQQTKAPVAVEISFTDLPEAVQNGLAEAARIELKKSRINYDNWSKKGAISWQLTCEVKR